MLSETLTLFVVLFILFVHDCKKKPQWRLLLVPFSEGRFVKFIPNEDLNGRTFLSVAGC